jgi:hypothetical protein
MTEVFPCFFLSCKTNTRVKLAKTGHGPHSSTLVVICVVLCITVIRPIVTYASERWLLKEAIIHKLLVFERKILRRIFGPTKENQIWRVKTNEELDKLIKHKYN